MPSYRFSLESSGEQVGATEGIPVPINATLASVAVEVHRSQTFGSAVADLQFSFDDAVDVQTGENLTTWRNTSPAVQFSSGTPFVENIPVAGKGRIRVKTTTADATADTDAYAVVIFR
jgi:hypothetical protein